MPKEIVSRMAYVQELFLRVQDHLANHPHLQVDEIFAWLDQEPVLFRSVAYESASMGLAYAELARKAPCHRWIRFLGSADPAHFSHVGIGLGWAIARCRTDPGSWHAYYPPRMRGLVFDGMGYYHALFRGRRTVKNKLIPDGVEDRDLESFDQGVGRRIWYMESGEADRVAERIQSFPSDRQAALWRGLGLACGYVGGTSRADLELLVAAVGPYRPQLRTGIAMAVLSRGFSNSITEELAEACHFICETEVADLLDVDGGMFEGEAVALYDGSSYLKTAQEADRTP